MSPRKELIAAGAIAVLGLLAAALGIVLGSAVVLTAAPPAALALCAAATATGVWHSTRTEAADLAATRIDQLTGLPNGAHLREDLSNFRGDRRELLADARSRR